MRLMDLVSSLEMRTTPRRPTVVPSFGSTMTSGIGMYWRLDRGARAHAPRAKGAPTPLADPPDGLTIDDVIRRAAGHELIVVHTSTPSIAADAKAAAQLKAALPGVRIGFVGAHTMVLPDDTLNMAPAVDFVALGEFD